MENVWILMAEGLFGRSRHYIVGWENVVEAYNSALMEGDMPELFETEINEMGFLTQGKKIKEYFDRKAL